MRSCELIFVHSLADILDDRDDVLVNISMVDQEKADKNVENRKGKPGYNPYEEEKDEFGDVSEYLFLFRLLEHPEQQTPLYSI